MPTIVNFTIFVKISGIYYAKMPANGRLVTIYTMLYPFWAHGAMSTLVNMVWTMSGVRSVLMICLYQFCLHVMI